MKRAKTRESADGSQRLKDLNVDFTDEEELFGPSTEEERDPVNPEGQEARRLSRPPQPSKEEVLQHELTHLPFRSWCRHCVRGKSNTPHTDE